MIDNHHTTTPHHRGEGGTMTIEGGGLCGPVTYMMIGFALCPKKILGKEKTKHAVPGLGIHS